MRFRSVMFWPRGDDYGKLTVFGILPHLSIGDEFIVGYGDAVILAEDVSVVPSTYRRAHRDRFEIRAVEIDTKAGEMTIRMKPIRGLYRPVYAAKKLVERAGNVIKYCRRMIKWRN